MATIEVGANESLRSIITEKLADWPRQWGPYVIAAKCEHGVALWFGNHRPVFEDGGWSDVGCVEAWLTALPIDANHAVIERLTWVRAQRKRKLLGMLVDTLPRWDDEDGQFACYRRDATPFGDAVVFTDSRPGRPGKAGSGALSATGTWQLKGTPVDADTAVVTRGAWLEEKFARQRERDQDKWAAEQASKFPAYWREIPAHWRYLDTYRIAELFPVDDESGAVLHARKKLLVLGTRTGGKSVKKDLAEAVDTLNCKINNMVD